MIRFYLTLSTLVLLSAPASAYNYFSKNENCLSVTDIKAVADHFKQFTAFTVSQAPEICKGEGIDEQWFEVVRSVLALKRLNVNGAISQDENDELTLRPIQEKDWWGYFTKRTQEFVLNPAYCKRRPDAIAFVYKLTPGEIHLCPQFYKLDTSAQIEALMHEVRHFDGHQHVTCTQGGEVGSQGACDDTILQGGSYAVSTQVSVELAFVNQLSIEERILSEASATYIANNKFNRIPKIKTSDYIYLANQVGELFRALVGRLEKLELVETLNSPARVLSNGSQLVMYPLDTNAQAYRTSRNLNVKVASLGVFANFYNSHSAADRSLLSAVNYFGLGAIAINGILHAFCGKNATNLSQHQVATGAVKSILALMTGDTTTENYVITESGKFHRLTCNQDTGALNTIEVDLGLPPNLLAGISFNTQEAFLLTESGELLKANMVSKEISPTALPAGTWISATPIRVHSIFEEKKDQLQ